MSKVLIPGSFDPVTKGHVDVIRRASKGFDHVVVAVMTNDMHKYVAGVTPKQYMFTMDERAEMVRLAVSDMDNVAVITSTDTLIGLVDKTGVDFVLKGLRDTKDFEYEQQHALYNRAHNPNAETLYLPADPIYDGISSTLAREKLRAGEDLTEVLPDAVIQWINAHKGA